MVVRCSHKNANLYMFYSVHKLTGNRQGSQNYDYSTTKHNTLSMGPSRPAVFFFLKINLKL